MDGGMLPANDTRRAGPALAGGLSCLDGTALDVLWRGTSQASHLKDRAGLRHVQSVQTHSAEGVRLADLDVMGDTDRGALHMTHTGVGLVFSNVHLRHAHPPALAVDASEDDSRRMR